MLDITKLIPNVTKLICIDNGILSSIEKNKIYTFRELYKDFQSEQIYLLIENEKTFYSIYRFEILQNYNPVKVLLELNRIEKLLK